MHTMQGEPVYKQLFGPKWCLNFIGTYIRHGSESASISLYNTPIVFLHTGLLIDVDNVRQISSFIDSSFSTEGRTMKFAAGATNEKLLEVPLVGVRDLDVDATIRITIGLQPPNPATNDRDPRVGLSDGVNVNYYQLVDQANYHNFPPCNPISATHDGTRVPNNSPVPYQYTLTFKPYNRYSTCYTAQNGGYVNTATFNRQLIVTKPLSLVVYRSDAAEHYMFKYFLVEIL